MPGSERQRSEIVIGLVATPPDYPAQVVGKINVDLTHELLERVDADMHWIVRQGSGDAAPRRDGGTER